MKSKIYSSRYMKVTSKGLVWIPAFVTIGFLLAFPVAELIMLGNWFGMEYTAREINALYVNLWQNGFMITGLAVAALAALFNGISQFWYLYSLRKIDFYHSLPVKRNRMFWYKTLQSLLYFLVPYLVMEFFAICIGAMRGFFSLHLMKLAFLMMVFHLMLYLLMYFSVVLVICITGHLLMGALLLVAAVAYGPVLSVLLDLYEMAFYYTRSESSYGFVKWLKEMASPFTISYTFVKKYAEGNYGGILIAVILVTAALGGLGYYAFVHRRSERTGMAFVFPWIGTVVKFLIVVPGGLGIGFIFYMLSSDSSRTIWWIFGLILGTLLAGGIMEIIYYRDFRRFFSHKIQHRESFLIQQSHAGRQRPLGHGDRPGIASVYAFFIAFGRGDMSMPGQYRAASAQSHLIFVVMTVGQYDFTPVLEPQRVENLHNGKLQHHLIYFGVAIAPDGQDSLLPLI